VDLFRNDSGYFAKPAGYILLDQETTEYRKVRFYGDIVNCFFRPGQVFGTDKDTLSENYNGEAIAINESNKFTKSEKIKILDRNVSFTVGISNLGIEYDTNIRYSYVKPKSYIELCFEENMEPDDFAEIYNNVYRLLQFTSFQRDIYFDEIKLCSYNNDDTIQYSGTVYINNKNKVELPNGNRTRENKKRT
jgi:hypothetical protein